MKQNTRKKRNRFEADHEKGQKIVLYQKEYELVANKVTSLSMSFLKGTYIIPISLIVALFSSYFSNDTYIASIVLIFLPLVLSLYGYNHIRYMTLQMKASEYCSHLEKEINKHYNNESILLWENKLARDNNQTFFEFWLFFTIYGINYVLLYIFGYNCLIESTYYGILPEEFAVLISISYLAGILLIVSFLLLFSRTAAKRIERKINSNDTEKNLSIEKKFRKMINMILILIFLLLPTAAMPLVYGFQKNSIQEARRINWKEVDCIIVLGNKLKCGQLSDDGIARMNGLLFYLDENMNDEVKIILSGGNGEAETMKRYLVNFVEKLEINCESNSNTTFQNLKNTVEMVDGNTVIITSDYHSFRTSMLLRKLGLDYKIVPIKTNRLRGLNMWKECYIIMVDMLKW